MNSIFIVKSIVLKTRSERPVGPIELLTGRLSSSVHLNEPLRGQTDIEPFKPSKPSSFFQTSQTLIATNICLLLRGPLSIEPIPHLILLKLKLIISPSLVQATRAHSNDKKAYKTFTWVMLPSPNC